MTTLKIGACLEAEEIASHRDWLFDNARDIELQDFTSYAGLSTEYEDRIAAANVALDGHTGRRGIHGPYEFLDKHNKAAELRPLITARILKAGEAAERVGARQVVLHSPYTAWYRNNLLTSRDNAATLIETIHTNMDPVVRDAEARGVTLVIENIVDVDSALRRLMV